MSSGTQKTKRPGVLPMSFLYRYLLRYKVLFFPAFAALIATAALSLAFPYYLGKLIGSPSAALRGEADPALIAQGVDRIVVTLLIILLVQAVIAFLRVQGFIKAGESAMNDIRRDIFARMIQQPLPFFHQHRAGELSGRIAGDLEILRETLMTTVPQFVRQFVILIGGLVFLLLSSVKLSLFMLALIPIIVLTIAVFGRSIKNFSRQTQEALSQSNVVVEESVSGIQELKAYTNEDYETSRYENALSQFREAAFRGAKARAFFVSFIIFALFGSISVVAWFGSGMLTRGEITTTEFTHFILFSVFVGASLGSIPEIFGQLQKADGATQRVREILASPLEEDEAQAPREPVDSLRFSKVSFSYPSRPHYQALRAVDLDLKKGERIAVVGSSGAGKSTLFQLILGFYAPQEGALFINDKKADEFSLRCRRQAIGLVPQDVLLFGGSIAENIRYGRPTASQEEIVEAARLAYAKDFIEDFEEGFDTLVGQRGVKLSGGQRQRIAIARAILADPELLLLDEATSALDSESEQLVQSALDTLMTGRTSIVIAHRLSTIRNCDRIYVMEAGQIVESGPHAELMARDSRYRHLAQTQLFS